MGVIPTTYAPRVCSDHQGAALPGGSYCPIRVSLTNSFFALQLMETRAPMDDNKHLDSNEASVIIVERFKQAAELVYNLVTKTTGYKIDHTSHGRVSSEYISVHERFDTTCPACIGCTDLAMPPPLVLCRLDIDRSALIKQGSVLCVFLDPRENVQEVSTRSAAQE